MSCGGKPGLLPERLQVSQGTLWSCINGAMPHFNFEMELRIAVKAMHGYQASSCLGESRCFFSMQKEVKFLSSFNGPQGTSRFDSGKSDLLSIARSTSGYLSSCCRGIRPHLEIRRKHRVPLEVRQGFQGSYQVSTGDLPLSHVGGMILRFSLEL